MSDINKTCIIDRKEYLLSDVEAMGFDGFSVSAHVAPYCSLLKRNIVTTLLKHYKMELYFFKMPKILMIALTVRLI